MTELVKQCSWCRRFLVGELWVESPELVAATVSPTGELAASHGMCPDCHRAMNAALDNAAAGDDDPDDELDR